MKKSYQLKVSTANLKNFFILEKLLKSFTSLIKIIVLPKKKKKFVMLKSPHVNKKSKEHFQFLRYQRLYYIKSESKFLLKQFFLKTPNDVTILLKITS